MRSRLAIITMLVLGFAFSGAGVGLALTGVGTADTSAADVQYDRPTENPTLTPPPVPAPEVIEETPAPANEVESEVDEGVNPVPAESDDEGDSPVAAVDDTQVTRQLGADTGGELPFTGFAAIPVLLMGLALLSAGFVLRRRGSGSDTV